MVKTNGLLRIFWPSNFDRTVTPGVIVGWRNSDTDLFVITILEDVEVKNVQSALRTGTLFRDSPFPVNRIFQLCMQSSLHVLGTVNYPALSATIQPGQISAWTSTKNSKPLIRCPSEAGVSIQVILFRPPDPLRMQYISLEPIALALGDLETNPDSTNLDEIRIAEKREKKRVAELVEKLKFHSVLRHRPTEKEVALPMIIQQINCSQEIAQLLQKNTPHVGPRRKRSMSVSERVTESAQSLYALAAWSVWAVFLTYVFPIVLRTFQVAVITHRMVAEGVLRVLEWQIPSKMVEALQQPASSTPLAIKDLSACTQQIHLRLQQLSYFPTQYFLLRKRNATWYSIPASNSDYIRFYNVLWLVANDIIIGIALGSFIIDNAQTTSDVVKEVLDAHTIVGLERMIRWLMSYPGGLKLNTELAAFLGDLFLWVIEYWSGTTISLIMPHLPTVLSLIGCTSFAGASLPMAIFSDLLSLLTLHIYAFYVASARIFNWQLTIIYSLFHLFRGKKRNVLRDRIDNCDYDLDQLLLGTILFTLLFFLLPTVAVFYLTFASARMAIITLKATLDTGLAFLNHFPLFALMLRLKDSRRLPAGIRFELLPQQDAEMLPNIKPDHTGDDDEHDQMPRKANISYVTLSSTPLSIGQIFAPYSHLSARVRKHYLSLNVIARLLSGRFVDKPPLDSTETQYASLPRHRASISQVWRSLTQFDVDETAVHPSELYGNGVSTQPASTTGKR